MLYLFEFHLRQQATRQESTTQYDHLNQSKIQLLQLLITSLSSDTFTNTTLSSLVALDQTNGMTSSSSKIQTIPTPLPKIQIVYNFVSESEEKYLIEKVDVVGGKGESEKKGGWVGLNGRR